MLHRLAFWCTTAGVVILLSAPSPAAVLVAAQRACAGACASWGLDDVPPPVLKKIAITVPRAGSVMVTFNAWGQCSGGRSSNTELKSVDFVTQIVNKENATPLATGAGAIRIQATIRDNLIAEIDSSFPFNLTSSRTFAVSDAGKKTYFVRMTLLSMSYYLVCNIFGGNMTAIYVSN
jgi:hypothetical protein